MTSAPQLMEERGREDTYCPPRRKLLEQVFDETRRSGIETVGRFVEEQDRWLAYEKRRESDFLAHAVAVSPDQLAVAIGQLEQAEQPLHSLLTLGPSRHPVQVRDVVQKLATREGRVDQRRFAEVTTRR